MAAYRVALLIPVEFTDAESTALADSLKEQGFVVLGHNRLCVAVRMNRTLIGAIAESKVIVKDIWIGKLPDKRVKALPEEAKRVSIFWNVFCEQGKEGVEESVVSRTLKLAQLEVRDDRVYDLAKGEFLSPKTERKSGKKSTGNWTLSQTYHLSPIPVFGMFGVLVGHYAVIQLTSQASVTCTWIDAKIQGPHHYKYLKLNGVPIVSIAQSGFIPFWEVTNQVKLISRASYGGTTKSLTTTITA